ncbi:hypothetical protein [Kytococcus sp. Marseille-QA3725]
MPRQARPKPIEVATSHGAIPWPTQPVTGTHPDQVTTERCRLIAHELTAHKAKTGTSNRDIANTTGVPRRTIDGLLDGSHVPDVATLARLEQGLGIRVWTYPETVTPQRGTPEA